jgi:glycosyltransferase involved in cell wall biosynthesis
MDPTSTKTPKISVVIASKVGPPFIDQCLKSIEKETKELGAEAIVVIPEGNSDAARIATEFPWTRVIKASEREVPALRRRGVDEARGELVAVIEEHCSAKEDWLHTAVAALSGNDYASVGGPIVDYNYDTLRDWVVYFCEYNDALPPVPEGETTELNDANIAYPRSVLIEHRDLLDEGYWPMTLHGTLLAKKHKFLSVPDMVVYHRGPFKFGYYLGQRYLFSRAYTGVRAQQRPVSWRLVYLLMGPLVPAMLLARMAQRVFSKRCRVGKFILALPLTVTALVVLVAGEWVGCLLGPGDALSKVE